VLANRYTKPALMVVAVVAMTTILACRHNPPPGSGQPRNPFDLVHYYYPMMDYAAERLGQGQIPLWNPYACCGVPFLATMQAAVLYPATWLAVLLSAERALPVILFLHFLLGGVFAAMFFSAVGRGPCASAVGGALFVFACMLGQALWLPEVTTIAWMPFLLLCVEKLIRGGGIAWWMALSLGTALQLLAGFPQFVVYTFYLLVPFAVLRAIQTHRLVRAGPWRGVRLGAGLLAAIGLAVGVAAAQLLPTKELADNSGRSRRLSPSEIHYLGKFQGASPTAKTVLANVINPQPKSLSFDVQCGVGYLGTVTIFLVVVAIAAGWRDPLTIFLVLATIVSFLLSFGYRGPTPWLYELYAALPTGQMFRTPGRFRLISLFCLITLATAGLDRFLGGMAELQKHPRRKAAVIIAVACLAVPFLRFGSSLAVALMTATIVLLAANAMLSRSMAHPAGPTDQGRSRRYVAMWLVRGLLVAILLADITHAVGRHGVLRALPLASAQCIHHSLDCSTAGQAAHPKLIMTADRFAELVAKAGYGRIALLDMAMPRKPAGPLPKAYMLTDYEALLPRRWHELFKTMGLPPKNFALRGYEGVAPVEYAELLDMAGVRFMIGPRWHAGRRTRRWGVATNEDALPRAYIVDRFELCKPTVAMRRILRPDFDIRGTVLVEKAPGIPMAGRGICGSARITRYEPELVEIQADAERPGWLVLTDTFYPGWRARVDGAEVEIIPANFLFRAVAIQPGRHRVVFEYRPDSFRYGAVVSLSSLAALATICLVAAWRRYRSPESPAR